MKVNHSTAHGTHSNQVERAGEKRANQSAAQEALQNASDKVVRPSTVEISESARLMQAAQDAVKAAPASPSQRISDLKKSIKEGSYRVDSDKLAEKILTEHLQSDFGKNNL